MQDKPSILKLESPKYYGDWHDKPVKWNVVWNNKNQLFATKKDAQTYARIWKKVGFKDELGAIKAFSNTWNK